MRQLVADLVVLETGVPAKWVYTAPAPTNGSNRVLAEVLFAAKQYGASLSVGIKCYPEYSNDLSVWISDQTQNWETGSNEPPYRHQNVFIGPTLGGTYRYVRLYFENTTDKRAAVSAWITLYSQNT